MTGGRPGSVRRGNITTDGRRSIGRCRTRSFADTVSPYMSSLQSSLAFGVPCSMDLKLGAAQSKSTFNLYTHRPKTVDGGNIVDRRRVSTYISENAFPQCWQFMAHCGTCSTWDAGSRSDCCTRSISSVPSGMNSQLINREDRQVNRSRQEP